MTIEPHECGTFLKEAIATSLNEKKPVMLAGLAAEHGVSEYAVACALPEEMRTFASPGSFDEIWRALAQWPSATFIMQHLGSVVEVKAPVPQGKYGHGYFNLMGDSPLGGHLKVDDVSAICLLSLPFMGLESLSVQFFNGDGAVKFSIYGGRDEKRQILPSVRESFMNMRQQFEQEKE